MGKALLIVLGIAGAAALLSVVGLMASAALVPSVSIELKKAPEWVYAMEEVSLPYWVNLTGYTYDSVTNTSACWDTVSHAGQGYYDIAWYPNASSALTGAPDGNYTVRFTAPNITGTVYFILHAVVDGVDYTSAGEYDIEVKSVDVDSAWIEVLSAPVAGLTGHDAAVSWRIHNISKDRRTGSTLYWDTASHSGAVTAGSYPHTVEGMADGQDDDCDGLVPLPDTAGTVYFVITVSVHGLPDVLMSGGEGTIICKASPVLHKGWAVSPALNGSAVSVNWTVSYPDSECADITETAIVWSLVSHSSRATSGEIMSILKEYDVSSPKIQGAAGGRYAVDITMPSTPCTVFFRAYAIVLGEPFMTEEQEIKVVSMQSFRVRESPTRVLSGEKVSARAELSFLSDTGPLSPVPGDALFPTTMVLYVDNRSHADLAEYLALTARPVVFAGAPGNFTANFTCTPEDQYFVLRCQVQGRWFWCAEEKKVEVVAHYIFTVESPFIYFLPNEPVTFGWTIDTGVASDVMSTTLAWDTVEHAPSEGIAPFANKLPGVPGVDGNYSATFTAPATPCSVYAVVHAIILGRDVPSPPIHNLTVMKPPSIEQVEYKSTVERGKDLKIRFTLINASVTDILLLEVRWDTESHAGSANLSLYPKAIGLVPNANGTYEVTFYDAKMKKLYFVIHAVINGRDFFAPGEGKVSVKEPSPGLGGPLAFGALALVGVAIVLRRRGRR